MAKERSTAWNRFVEAAFDFSLERLATYVGMAVFASLLHFAY